MNTIEPLKSTVIQPSLMLRDGGDQLC